MLHVELESPSPPASSTSVSASASAAALAALSRNTSVISSSSSSSSSSSLLLNTVRPGPIRTFSSPGNRSPTGGSTTPTRAKAPVYLSKEAITQKTGAAHDTQDRAYSRKTRSNSNADRLGPNDFEIGKIVGEGSYSTVMVAVYPPTRKIYAIKVMDKEPLIRKNMVGIASVEKNVLVKLGDGGHPGIIKLHWTFQDQWSWYFVLDFVSQGELQTRINRLGSICLPCARWYTAQIIDATAWMHARGVLHRDLKPENILLDDNMRIKITDFGSAKIIEGGIGDDRSNSWVGTPQYVPPELLLQNSMCKSSDYWAIGCILYQMISGAFPFHGSSNYLMWVKVKALDYSFPDGFDDAARDLVTRFLVLEPDLRIGGGKAGSPNDVSALRAHRFFETLSWDKLWSDPVPNLEAGIVAKEVSLTQPGDNFDAGAEWEQLAGAEADDADDANADVQNYGKELKFNGHALMHSSNSSADSILADLEARIRKAPIQVSTSSVGPAPLAPCDVPVGDPSPGESPTGRLGGIFESLALSTRSRRPSTTSNTSTPLSDPARWMSLLRPSETPVFSSCVQSAARRGFPRLPLSGGTKKGPITSGRDKVKMRLLVLTKTRLLCLKERDGEVVVKSEVLIGGQGGGIGVVTGVEKGDQTFVVQTASKAYIYAAEDSALVARWAKEIGDALPPTATLSTDQLC